MYKEQQPAEVSVPPSQAQKGDAVGVATSVLRRAGAEADAVLDDIARIIAVCSGPAATGALARSDRPPCCGADPGSARCRTSFFAG